MTNLYEILTQKFQQGYYASSERAVRAFGFPPETVSAIVAEAGRKGISAEAVVIQHLNLVYKEAR